MQLDNMFSFRTNVLLDNSTTNFLLSFGPRLQTIELNQIRDVQISDILSNCHLLQSFTLDKCTFKTSQFDEHPQQHFGQHLEKIKIVGGSRLKFYEDRIADSNLEYGELVNLFQCPNVRDIHIGYCSAYFDHVLLSAFRKHRFSNSRVRVFSRNPILCTTSRSYRIEYTSMFGENGFRSPQGATGNLK